jgi:hypothetical protein
MLFDIDILRGRRWVNGERSQYFNELTESTRALRKSPFLLAERLIQIFDQVVGVFQTDGQSQQAFRRSCSWSLD